MNAPTEKPETSEARNEASVRQFILGYIDSVELVKVLLLLAENPRRAWSAQELTEELRSSLSAIQIRLRDLYQRRILQKNPYPDKHRYVPYDDAIRRHVEELRLYNEQYPYRVIEMIYSRREDAIRSFADAFSLKKEKEK